MNNKGYINAVVNVDTIAHKKKMKVRYKVTTNKPYHIENISYNIPNTDIEKIIMKDTASLLLKPDTTIQSCSSSNFKLFKVSPAKLNSSKIVFSR